MTTEIERKLKAKIRTATREEYQSAVDTLNQLLEQVRALYVDLYKRPAPLVYESHLVVRTNKRGAIIIGDTRTNNKIELAELDRRIRYYKGLLKDLQELMEDDKEIKRIEELIIEAVGEERFRWYRSKTDPQDDL